MFNTLFSSSFSFSLVVWCWYFLKCSEFSLVDAAAKTLGLSGSGNGNGFDRIFMDFPLPGSHELKYAKFGRAERENMREQAKLMFQFAYDSYMRYAFPMDELDPIHCTGRGPDYDDPSNININDVLGDYSLGLVDSLTTLVVMQNRSEFKKAVQNVIEYVNFDKDNTVQVFEATIRVLGALLSAHMIITDPQMTLGDYRLDDYNGELLTLAHDLANRLLPAFENTKTGLPFPRVNLMHGVSYDTINETCTSGAGSLLLEFGVLSRLLGDPTYEHLARRTNKILWGLRDNETGLLGNIVNIQTGEWVSLLSGLGAGLDSFYEYLLKAYILFGDKEDYRMFNESYTKIKGYLRRGRDQCNSGIGDHPMYVNVYMKDGSTANTWIDSLQASFAGVQILNGDIDEAICQHALYYSIWKKYGVLPERYNWHLNAPDVTFYPLRPEFAESTYLLYMTTKNPFYLHVGREILESLNNYSKVQCGYATVHDVHDKSLEDRMESFFLSETCKYLYLLFDESNPVNRHYAKYIFTTEGHLFPILSLFRDWSPASSVLTNHHKNNENSHRPYANNWIRPASRHEEEQPKENVDEDSSTLKCETKENKETQEEKSGYHVTTHKHIDRKSAADEYGYGYGKNDRPQNGGVPSDTDADMEIPVPLYAAFSKETAGATLQSMSSPPRKTNGTGDSADDTDADRLYVNSFCPYVPLNNRFGLPLRSSYLLQLFKAIGLEEVK